MIIKTQLRLEILIINVRYAVNFSIQMSDSL